MEFLSVGEVAQLWGVSERSVRGYCAQGRIPGAFLVGKTWNIPSDAQKPTRSKARDRNISPLLERLRAEKAAKTKGGIYHKIQVDLTYNSNHIEGSKLTLDQTRLIFETSTIGLEKEALRVDDIVETVNHFRAIDYLIDHAQEPLSQPMIKRLHGLLKAGTSDSFLDWFAVGGYKELPNEVAGRQTTEPELVVEEMTQLLEAYRPSKSHTFEDIVGFHVRFERIHPFQDGNGRIGRLILFKECLKSGLVPFVVADDMKAYYYRGLAEWDEEQGFLLGTCLAAQDRMKAALDYFRISY